MKYNMSNIQSWPHFAALEKFASSITEAIDRKWKADGFTHNEPPQVRIGSIGPRYIRLRRFEKDRSGVLKATSSYCSVDLTDGSVWKDSWKAVVNNGKRGNLNDAGILTKAGVYGLQYLTGGNYESVARILQADLLHA